MKLPNASLAEVSIEKLRDYCLNPQHLRGKHKARVFEATLGLIANDAAWLRDRLLEATVHHDCLQAEKDAFGQRYVLDFEASRGGRNAMIRSCWIVRTGELHPRLTSCFVK